MDTVQFFFRARNTRDDESLVDKVRYFGRSDRAERTRRCPSCGKAWLRKEPLHRIFDFQCRRCRLLSNVAFDVRLGI
jgi:predicted  nucleic acid-binding Zn ribbon protein